MDRATTISTARGAARMSQEHLAQAAGVSVRTVIRAEGGRQVSHESLRALSAVLGLEATTLRGDSSAADTSPQPDELRALLSVLERPGDEASLREDFADLLNRVALSMAGVRAVGRPDVDAYRRWYNRAQGAPLDPCVPGYYARLRRLYKLMAGGLLAAFAMLFWMSGMNQAPEASTLGIAMMAAPITIIFLVQSACHLVRNAERKERVLAVTLYLVDATHLHEISLRRWSGGFLIRRDGPDLFRCSVPLDRITDVTRRDTQGRVCLNVTGGREMRLGFIDMATAAEFETLIGFKVRRPLPREIEGDLSLA